VTVEEIRARVQEIKNLCDDNEAAHSLEDALDEDVLTAIADGAQNPAELARAALATKELEFERWYA
jgi:hypothetical protein